MSTRTINISKYKLPGSGLDQEVSIEFALVDADGKKIDGYRSTDDVGIIGARTITLTDAPRSIELTPNTEIYPESYWNVRVKYSNKAVRSANVKIGAGTALSFAEFLAIDTSPGFWDIYVNRLLPDPTDLDVGKIPSVTLVGGTKIWGTATATTAPPSDGSYYAYKDGSWVDITNMLVVDL